MTRTLTIPLQLERLRGNDPTTMPVVPDSSPLPELVFAIAGPIGVDIDAICASLTDALRSVRYDAQIIHLTEEMMMYRPRKKLPDLPRKIFTLKSILRSSTQMRSVQNSRVRELSLA